MSQGLPCSRLPQWPRSLGRLAGAGLVSLCMPWAAIAGVLSERLATLHQRVFTNDGSTFSGSAMSADLDALRPLLQSKDTSSEDAFRLHYTMATVYGRRNMPAEAAAAAQMALNAPLSVLKKNADAHFFLRLSSIRWLADSGKFEAALETIHRLQAEYPLPKLSPQLQPKSKDDLPHHSSASGNPTLLQILGVYEDEGYVLHEQGRYREALAANQRLLAVARTQVKAIGRPELLRGVLNNAAQNAYELGDFSLAGQYLKERADIAKAAQDHETVYDSYFQLMVLAHEQAKHAQARGWIDAYSLYAKRQNDPSHIDRAQRLRDELEQKTSSHTSP